MSAAYADHAAILGFQKDDVNDFIMEALASTTTALTMRFFYLPAITLIWLKELLKLRGQIYEKKKLFLK